MALLDMAGKSLLKLGRCGLCIVFLRWWQACEEIYITIVSSSRSRGLHHAHFQTHEKDRQCRAATGPGHWTRARRRLRLGWKRRALSHLQCMAVALPWPTERCVAAELGGDGDGSCSSSRNTPSRGIATRRPTRTLRLEGWVARAQNTLRMRFLALPLQLADMRVTSMVTNVTPSLSQIGERSKAVHPSSCSSAGSLDLLEQGRVGKPRRVCRCTCANRRAL